MNQAELRQMAVERILDAAALLAGDRWSFAYYVAGYAVECALNSCVLARMIHTGGVFKDKRFAEQCFTHDFVQLVRLAGLQQELNARLAAGGAFPAFWGTALQWRETSRYETKTEAETKSLYEAIINDPDGVLRWTRSYW
ncbi:MAG: hypothetical protein HYS13_07115 [Planctomycetia bacterium]|nr:hypothetical protein [Planctomycetia bacterium]